VSAPTPDPGAFVQWLGLEMLEASADKVVAAWDVRPDMLQPYGIVHGGVHCSVIETVASYAAALWFPEGQVVGVANQTDFLRAARDGRLTATGTPIHRGRLQQLWIVRSPTSPGGRWPGARCRLQNLPADRM
jgi:uncharacterized domain 1